MMMFLLGAMTLSLLNMSAGMDMTGSMSDCPFMEHGEVVCAMNLSDHIGAWKSTFLAVIQTVTFLLSSILAAAYVATIIPNLLPSRRLRRICVLTRWLKERTYSFSYRPLQELFSNGILHPKLF